MAEGTLGYSSDRRRFFAKYEHDASKIRPRFPYSDKQWKMTGCVRPGGGGRRGGEGAGGSHALSAD